jgi:23S rRNA (uridine2552-2'-O)-methyltransferase
MSVKKRQSRSKSSRQWLKDHFDDVYVKQAQKAGYRSRAVYKLLEIQEKDHILKRGMTVVDLGAAPGGWSQVASHIVGASGKVVALDILPMDSLAHVEIIQGDFTEPSVFEQLLEVLEGQEVDLVMSDMAPNISGMKAVDQPRAMYLAELAMDFAQNVLKPGGDFLTKIFQGEGFDEYLTVLRASFDKVVIRKPKASRPKSREVYMLARGFKK